MNEQEKQIVRLLLNEMAFEGAMRHFNEAHPDIPRDIFDELEAIGIPEKYDREIEDYRYGSGYCSQEKMTDRPDPQCFEIFWEPANAQFSVGTSADAKAQVRFDDPAGFSGSLVWNTRYLEVTNAGKSWSPEDAVVTGMLRRYDPDTNTLLALRVEQRTDWLEKHLRKPPPP